MLENRIAFIDIVKGILICHLLYGHMMVFARNGVKIIPQWR